MAKTDTEASPYVCDVEGCGRSFTRPQGLGRHRVEIHGFAPASAHSRAKNPPVPEPDPNTYEGQVKLQLASLAAPLKVQLADIEAKIRDTVATLADLRRAKVDVTSILVKLEPREANGNGNKARGSRDYHAQLLTQKADKVVELLEAHPDRFPEGFTANLLAESFSEEVPKGLSTKSAGKVLDILRDRNIVRADRITRGGGMSFHLIERAG